MPRRLLQLPIVAARRTDRISIAAPDDFTCGRAQSLQARPVGAFPYCLDFVRARAIYVQDLDVGEVQAAPFYYLHLRRRARSLVSVPLEFGPLSDSANMKAPIFLYSPGRCGSTLLSRILFEARIACVSEVDFYTQMTTPFWSDPHNPLRKLFCRAMWNMTRDLVATLGTSHAPIVKLRAESCYAPELLLPNTDGRPRTLVMFRRFESWARSTCRTFGANAGKAVEKYMLALKCYEFLQAHSDCHVVRYEDLLSNPQETCTALGCFLGLPIGGEAIVRAGERDAQEGTPLGRGVGRQRAGWEAKFDATMRLWHSQRVVHARDSLGIQNVWA